MVLRERLAAEHPSMIDYQIYLAGSCVNVGELAVREGDYAGAITNLDRADAVLDGVLSREPRHEVARFYAAYSASWRARALDASGHLREGERAWKRAASFNDRGYPTIPAGYARGLARRGDVKRALEQARAVEEAEQLPGEVLYDLAATYSLAAAREPDRRDAHAARAMRLLERARDLGFFEIPGAVEGAASDPDLRALERLPGWEKLVGGVPSSP
jgi:tetratricopeptide (TPR) repeat protein